MPNWRTLAGLAGLLALLALAVYVREQQGGRPTVWIATRTPSPTLPTPASTSPRPSRTAAPPTPTAPPSTPTAPPPTPTAAAGPPGADALEGRLLAQIGALRAQHGLPPYRTVPELSAAARAHSCDLAVNHMISHQSSDGRTLQQRMPALTPPLIWPSESIAAGTDDPAQVIAMWLDEPPEGWHRRNLLDPDQQVIGAGYCFATDDPTGNHHYWTIDIARVEGAGAR